MKKSFIAIILVLAMCFIEEVKAVNPYDVKQTYGENGYLVLCEYEQTGSINAGIYYSFEQVNPTDVGKEANWFIYYTKDDIYKMFDGSWHPFKNTFAKNKKVSYEKDGQRFKETFGDEFVCPKNVSIKIGGFPFYTDKICFDNDKSCASKYPDGTYTLSTKSETIFDYIDKTFNTFVNSYETARRKRNGEDVNEYIKNNLLEYTQKKYGLGTTYVEPAFVKNYIKNKIIDDNDIENSEAFKGLQEKMDDLIDKDLDKGNITEEQAAEEKKQVAEMTSDKLFKKSMSSGIGTDIRDGTDCNAIFGVELTKAIKSLFRFIQYLGPLLVALLSVVDFAKAALSGDPGDMKKASDKLMKRVIAAVLLFFIPIICGLLFDFGGITVPSSCIVK